LSDPLILTPNLELEPLILTLMQAKNDEKKKLQRDEMTKAVAIRLLKPILTEIMIKKESNQQKEVISRWRGHLNPNPNPNPNPKLFQGGETT